MCCGREEESCRTRGNVSGNVEPMGLSFAGRWRPLNSITAGRNPLAGKIAVSGRSREDFGRIAG